MVSVAAKLFLETEGIDIHPAPSVALATLIKAIENGRVDRKATIMLNITGGGEQRFMANKDIWYLEPSHIFSLKADAEDVVAKVEALFK